MSKPIYHKGIITKISNEEISVEIVNKSLCSTCHAKSVCAAGAEKDKIINVPYFNNGEFKIGQEVFVVMEKSMGFKAVWISYVIPLIILLVFLLTLHSFNLNELLIGLISLIFIMLYYFVVYLIKDKISNKFVFTIKECSK